MAHVTSKCRGHGLAPIGFSRMTAVVNSVSRANQRKSGLPPAARRTSTRGGVHDCPRPEICPLPPG
jgi:hypothetical protein